MITLRMLGIAVAILLGLPAAFAVAHHTLDHLVVEGGNIVNAGLEAGGEVTDIVLLETITTYDRQVVHNAPEQLVEGHTVFVTWDIKLIPNVTNWTYVIAGDVGCEHYIEGEGQFLSGLPIIPRRMDRAQVECHANEHVFVTPDPFVDSDDVHQSTMAMPTGRVIPFTTPAGDTGQVTEYSYEVTKIDWLGEATTQTLYMWSAPVLSEWLHTDGKPRSWYCPLPVDRLQEMAITNFAAYLDGDARLPHRG